MLSARRCAGPQVAERLDPVDELADARRLGLDQPGQLAVGVAEPHDPRIAGGLDLAEGAAVQRGDRRAQVHVVHHVEDLPAHLQPVLPQGERAGDGDVVLERSTG